MVDQDARKANASMLAEEWRPVPGFPGYEVSSHGRVRSLDRVIPAIHSKHGTPYSRPHRGKVLSPTTGKWGHQFLKFWQKNAEYTFSVHKIVALAFLDPRPTPNHQIAHNDGNARNNQPSNLRWATDLENKADMVLHGTRPQGESHGRAVLNNGAVRAIRDAYACGDSSHAAIAACFRVSRQQVGKIIRREKWAAT